ncbi:hypothetical protein ASF70_23160 [Rhizobium sp. Leaf321]|uniref:DUF2852 domain-containing protein n=1 Tax=Rhizobium sp. Leaf321 TaxID=1736335 RepID=UPI0007131059|nr:DUF2852 domain-containing protein [Rhizobium sp. Leaf321]KQQ78522.1 hypothetical protein ASF70_23160 [Rhizobium sp. Leaf321]
MNQSALIRPEWTPATIGLMVLGFVVFWPLGLAMLAYIIFGDRLRGFKRDANNRADEWAGKTSQWFSRSRAAGYNTHFSTGNVAFDDWRKAELNRMDEERRKLDEMRDEFDNYSRELRRAKDQEEFDRFMRERRNSNASGQNPVVDV